MLSLNSPSWTYWNVLIIAKLITKKQNFEFDVVKISPQKISKSPKKTKTKKIEYSKI